MQPQLAACFVATGLTLVGAVCAQTATGQQVANRPALTFFPPGSVVTVGPGGNFVDIQSAVDFVSNGVTVVVAPGSYDGFVIDDKQVTLLGTSGVQVTSNVVVQNIAPGNYASLADFDLTALDIVSSPGCVILDSVRFSEDFAAAALSRNSLVDVNGAQDVRMRGATFDLSAIASSLHALEVRAGRAEIASATISGADGADTQDGFDGLPAGAAIMVGNGARAHVALTSLTGGAGGISGGFGELGGDGGPAVSIEDSGDVIVTGLPGDELRGGAGGLSVFGYDGGGGSAIALARDGLSKSVRHSGIQLIPGLGGPSGPDGEVVGPVLPGDMVVSPAVPDPSLEVIGSPINGNPAATTVRVHAVPGANVALLFGREATVQVSGTAAVELLVIPTATFPLGVVPPSGNVEMNLFLGGIERGGVAFVQAEVTFMSNLERTNSGALVVR